MGKKKLVNVPNELSSKAILSHNYPNPFRNQTTIEYSVAEGGEVNISIYDVLGRKIKTLTNKHVMPGNRNKVIWNFEEADLDKISSGVYFYRMTTSSGKKITRKMTYIN